MSDDAFLREAEAHDERLRALGVDAWIGAEPTFTRRDSQHKAWLFEALGDDKEERARSLVRTLAPLLGSSVALTTVEGRQYPGEPRPRFAFAARWPRVPSEASIECDELDAEPTAATSVDTATTAFLTVTPDPGVVEINAAPCPDLASFLAQMRAVYLAADRAGLSPVRFRYNGQVCDSGGGGQLSFGGPSAERSPFLLHPRLLPSLLRFVNHHPSLSYAFAPACIGSASQGPRPDEGVRERFEELGLALDLIDVAVDRNESLSPEDLWGRLASLLVDGSGNSHRAEVNIEKLWSPHLGSRGKLGVVELRSLSMPETPERLTALAALFRSLVARCVQSPFRQPLVDWGGALHDRFALPSLLASDLHGVLDDLEAHGVGLGSSMRAEVCRRPEPSARIAVQGAELVITPAREFWPLLGDTASQEHAGARLVDASTERVEIVVRVPDGMSPGTVTVCGVPVPLQSTTNPVDGAIHVAGVRYRAFVPQPGLHETLPKNDPLEVSWTCAGETVSLALHGWCPNGGGYEGLPDDAVEAARRRQERVVMGEKRIEQPSTAAMNPSASSRFTIDLRQPLRS